MTTAPVLDGPRREAARPPAQQLVVLLHGWGADGDDLISLAEEWGGTLPHAEFAAPDAPEPHPMLATGRQWFELDAQQVDLSNEQVVAAVERAASAVNRFADADLARLGLPPGAVAFVGFSQGATVALVAGFARGGECAGVVAYSGALAGGRVPATVGGAPPVLLRHGERDDVVPPVAMEIAARALSEAGVAVESRLVPGLGHGIDSAGIDRGAAFLGGCFGP